MGGDARGNSARAFQRARWRRAAWQGRCDCVNRHAGARVDGGV